MPEIVLDEVDRGILHALQLNGRATNLELARRVGLSPAATHARVRSLERRGVIGGYAALVDREQLGFDLLCLVGVQMQVHRYESIGRMRDAIAGMPEVLECHHITGEYDYQLKVVVRNRRELERFVVERLTPLPGVARIHTSLVLDEVKSTTVLPLEELSDASPETADPSTNIPDQPERPDQTDQIDQMRRSSSR